MRRALALAVLLAPAACVPPRSASVAVPAAPQRPAPPPEPEVKDPNFILTVSEVVPDPALDGVSFTKVFVDGREAGATPVGPNSTERTLKLKLPAGNEPVRLEHWVLPPVGEWTRLDDSLQPRERFVRIEDGTIVRLDLRFSEGEASNSLSLTRESAGH